MRFFPQNFGTIKRILPGSSSPSHREGPGIEVKPYVTVDLTADRCTRAVCRRLHLSTAALAIYRDVYIFCFFDIPKINFEVQLEDMQIEGYLYQWYLLQGNMYWDIHFHFHVHFHVSVFGMRLKIHIFKYLTDLPRISCLLRGFVY